MPWCEECAKYYTPNSVHADGTCRQCGTKLQAGEGDDVTAVASAVDDEKTPWHFKLLVTMTGLYLAWRLVDWIAL